MNRATALHLRAVRLPFGATPEDWWIVDGVLSRQPVANATPLPGAYVMAGMVDAHTHLSMGFGRFDFPDGGDAVIAANLSDKAAQGVLAVRDTGLLPGASVLAAATHPVRVTACGNMHAPAGRFHDGIYTPVEAGELVAAGLREAAQGQHWIKIVADFPGPDFNFYEPIVNYPVEVIRALCEAVHAQGARVAAHATGPLCDALVDAGVDSIEHGNQLTPAGLREMARRGAAWTPTLSTIVSATEMMASHNAPFVPAWRAGLAKVKEMLPAAQRLGVAILAGSDEQPASFAREVALLHEFGLSPEAALAAASDNARTFLRFPAFEAGAPADVVLFDRDPRLDLSALAKPAAVVSGGEVLHKREAV